MGRISPEAPEESRNQASNPAPTTFHELFAARAQQIAYWPSLIVVISHNFRIGAPQRRFTVLLPKGLDGQQLSEADSRAREELLPEPPLGLMEFWQRLPEAYAHHGFLVLPDH